MEMCSCPSCGSPAEIVARTSLDSTDGPVEHLRIRCLEGHRFFLLAESVETDSTVIWGRWAS